MSECVLGDEEFNDTDDDDELCWRAGQGRAVVSEPSFGVLSLETDEVCGGAWFISRCSHNRMAGKSRRG
jgi:hypothetical protein